MCPQGTCLHSRFIESYKLEMNPRALKEKEHCDCSALFVESARRESDPRPSPWQGDVVPLYYSRIINVRSAFISVKNDIIQKMNSRECECYRFLHSS